jgi:hypothetical protein
VTGASEALEPGAWSTINLGVIDLDTTELQSNDRDIYEAVLECMLANPVELGIEAPEAATSTAAASADVGASSSGALMPGATATEQPTPGQGGDVGGPAPSIASKAAEGVLGESVAGAESAVITPPLPTTGAIVDVPPPLIAGATPQDTRDRGGSGAALPRDAEVDDARILDLAHVLWAATFEVDNDAEEDAESTTCNTLERGLAWARRAFDELILPATLVSSLCTAAHL